MNPWLVAARPHTLPAAASPVLVAAGLAAGDGAFRWDALAAAMVGALAIQVAANFANDAADAARGADTPDRVGPPRMVALGVISAGRMWAATWLAVAVAALAGAYLIWIAGWVVAAIGVASVLAMLGYVAGPVPYGYRGLGEVFVFVFFGLVATVGARYVHDRSAPLDAWVLAVPMGLLAAAILVANNLRDIRTDAAAGKRTLAVLMGPERTRILYAVVLSVAFLVVVVAGLAGVTPTATALVGFLAPWGVGLARTVLSGETGAGLVTVLKGTARLQLAVGAALALAAAA